MIKNENYYQVAGWMRNEFDLDGYDIAIYAIIYGFSQDGEGAFEGSLSYLCDFTGASRSTVQRSLANLVEKDLISKATLVKNGVSFNSYKTNDTGGIKMTRGGYQNDLEGVSKRPGGGVKMTYNNKLDNKLDNKDDSDSAHEQIVPDFVIENRKNLKDQLENDITIEKVKLHFEEKNYPALEAEKFFHYYDARNWELKNKPVGNWKSLAGSWMLNASENSKTETSKNPVEKAFKTHAEKSNIKFDERGNFISA